MTEASVDRCKAPQVFWRGIERLGLRPADVLRRARLPASLHLNPEAVVTTAQIFALWKAAEALAEDPAFGLKLLEARHAMGHKPAFLAASYSADYREALHKVNSFRRFGACVILRFEECGGQFSIFKEWPFATEPEPALSTDMSFASLLELGRLGTGADIVPIRMDFARAGRETEAHRAYFGCSLHYGQPRNRLVLRSADLDRPFPRHNPELLEILAPALTEAPREFQAGLTLGEQVEAVLRKILPEGRSGLADVARELSTSQRTLQRRIAKEGVTFRALLMQVRCDLWRRLLADPSLDLDRVAGLLGYHNTSSFHRAFHSREGITPGLWRSIKA